MGLYSSCAYSNLCLSGPIEQSSGGYFALNKWVFLTATWLLLKPLPLGMYLLAAFYTSHGCSSSNKNNNKLSASSFRMYL